MNRPQVMLDWHRDWCARHLEPFRDGWPAGAAVAMVKLLDAAVNDERLIAAMPKDADGLADTAALEGVLAEHGPLCCFVGEEAMAKVYEAAGKEPPGAA